MSVKPIREHAGKSLLEKLLPEVSGGKHKMGCAGVLVTPAVLDPTSGQTWDKILQENPWLKTTNLVAKPDQLIKRRGKAGLIAVNKTFDEAKQWVMDRMCKEQKVEHVTGQLTHFLIEPFVPHKQEQEHYICMLSHRYHDEILFYHEGGVDVGDVDAKAEKLELETGEAMTEALVTEKLLSKLPAAKKANMASFICSLYKFYGDLHFAYLEINPLVMLDDNTVIPLDMAAKIDETANFLVAQKWGELDWPPPFGRAAYPEEALIHEMDGRTGASLKLTILNEKGRVWTMVAGGGASVVYADTVADYGMGHELANYGEYSGAPSTEETFVYAKTLLSLMMKYKHPEGKFLIIGGGIANFTDVAATFTGLIKALQEYADDIKEHNIKILIRRAGPNYLEGLRKVKAASDKLGLGIKVVEEQKRESDPGYSKKIAARKTAEDEKKEEDDKQKDSRTRKSNLPEGKEYLEDSMEYAEKREAKKKKGNPDAFGWDVFNQDSLLRAHDKRLNQIQFHKEAYEKQKADIEANGEDGLQFAGFGFKPSQEAKDRLSAAMDKMAEKKKDFSRRRAYNDDEDRTYVNARNRFFNKKLDRFFGDYTEAARSHQILCSRGCLVNDLRPCVAENVQFAVRHMTATRAQLCAPCAMSEIPTGVLRVYFRDNTYKSLQLTLETSVKDVIQRLCQRIMATGREVDPERHELLIIAPGPLGERKLQPADRPLAIQEKAGCAAYKFLFREIPKEGISNEDVEES
ncbi:unnamed protein product, partial [Effrenium voratum]